jgi:hypothetical protein
LHHHATKPISTARIEFEVIGIPPGYDSKFKPAIGSSFMATFWKSKQFYWLVNIPAHEFSQPFSK